MSNNVDNKRYAREKSWEKYSNKDNVLKKWIELNKKLNKNKDFTYYAALILEACGLVEHIVDIKLKDNNKVDLQNNTSTYTGKTVNFYWKMKLLKEEGYLITDEDEKKIREIKEFRNLVAHNTQSCIGKLISFDEAKEYFYSLGLILNKLQVLDSENIKLDRELLTAEVGDVLEDIYELEELIGEGGTSRVFKGYHKRLGIPIAVKEVKWNVVDDDIVNNEKKMLLSLNHQGIPRIYDIAEVGGNEYIIMDHISGETLEDFIKSTYPLANNTIAYIGKQLCDIISYLHKNNIIFNDIKPSNIIISKNNKVFLIDFGISKNLNTSEQNNIYYGTYLYSSPEQLEGKNVDIRSDIYSLGATLYYMVEGENPQAGSEQRFKDSTDRKLKAIIQKAMSINADERYISVEELDFDLDEVKEDGEEKTTIDSNIKGNNIKTNNKALKKRMLFSGAAVAVLLIALILIKLPGNKNSGGDAALTQNNNNNNNESISGEGSSTGNENSENVTSDDVETEGSVENEGSNNGEPINAVDSIDENATDSIASGSAFEGQFEVTIDSYNISGDSLDVNVSINNNYSKEITLYNTGIYVMNEKGNKFELDIHRHLSKGENKFSYVTGENKNLTFHFKGYADSEELAFNLDSLFVMGPEAMTEKVSIKFK